MPNRELVDVVLRLEDLKKELFYLESEFKAALHRDKTVPELLSLKDSILNVRNQIKHYSSVINNGRHVG